MVFSSFQQKQKTKIANFEMNFVFLFCKIRFDDLRSLLMERITYIKFIQQFWQIRIAVMFMHMNVEKYGLATLIRIASSAFDVFQEN